MADLETITKQFRKAQPRFYCVQSFATMFADHLRLAGIRELGRFSVGMAATLDECDASQAPIQIDLPKQDRRAYERACAAFNAVMDEHQARTAERNARRRVARAGRAVQ